MNIQIEARNMKLAAPKLANTSIEQRNKALLMIADALENSKDKIFAANDEDMEAAAGEGLAMSIQKRLKFNDFPLIVAIDVNGNSIF